MTIGERYDPVLKITEQAEADACFERLVQEQIAAGKSREEAEKIERSNIAYYATYFGEETRGRMEKLFRCAHPILGSVAENGSPSIAECLDAGARAFEERHG